VVRDSTISRVCGDFTSSCFASSRYHVFVVREYTVSRVRVSRVHDIMISTGAIVRFHEFPVSQKMCAQQYLWTPILLGGSSFLRIYRGEGVCQPVPKSGSTDFRDFVVPWPRIHEFVVPEPQNHVFHWFPSQMGRFSCVPKNVRSAVPLDPHTSGWEFFPKDI
jgi:hypothetical protein